MFKPFFAFVGCRYIKAKRKDHFISFISISSMLGIALGITVLITVLSVMNGFSKEIRKHMLSVTPHITLRSYSDNLTNWEAILNKISKYDEIKGAAPYVMAHGMLTVNGITQPSLIRGVQPDAINDVYPLQENILAGNLESLAKNSFGIILGKPLADNLGVMLGDKINLIAPEATITPAGILPRIKSLTVTGIFESNTHYDNQHAFINLDDAKKIFKVNGISGIQVKVNDELSARKVANSLNKFLEFKYWITDWTYEYESFFEAIKMEKTVMWCILLLIICVAAFNLVSSLVMMVTDKRADIAVMRTMGANPRNIMGIFIVQGCLIGFIGTLLGLIFGLLLATNTPEIVAFIQTLFDVQFISKDVYYIGHVPSEIESSDVIFTCLSALILSAISTIYPALKASKIQPAEALKYE